ncbi:putative diguanylate cyclase YdaM [Fundidesulfovibrio magnetotacticus]|uniref:diguanylate cyclase n=1 Tax=Fundidesulfovibrio magnetotacticus TaxID=2730080 RepID=A0A6V8LPQ3_9BACT|nr:diguanylate cyclase [Fundidesulfovibrio magnetotacticus]GFK94543.1 putative diguanylate cyclase YdaM [Fundidesulfovibrio magnetotacticus]
MPLDPAPSSPAPGVRARLGVTSRFGLAFAVVLAAFVLGGAVNFASMMIIHDAEADIQTSMDVRQKVFDMDAGLEKARRLYRDFLLTYQEVGFAKAQETYGQPAFAATARVIAVNEELRNLMPAFVAGESLRRRNMDITLYLSIAKRFSTVMLESMALLTALADPENGLETRLDQRMAELKAVFASNPNLSFLVREAELDEKRYRITRQRPSMQLAFNKLSRIRLALGEMDSMPMQRKLEAIHLVDDYATLASRVLDADVEVRSKINDMSLQAKTIDPISQELRKISQDEVTRSRERIERVSGAALWINLGMTLLGIACAAGAAAYVSRGVTWRILAITRGAERVRAGNLEVTVDPGGRDELGALAEAFNQMTGRIRELVDHLEETLRGKDRELDLGRRALDAKQRALLQLSPADRLTGLCNRRRLEHSLRAELRRHKRFHSAPFSVILLDVDLFKTVNDRFGQQVGDLVLVRIADALEDLARETDTVGRWGGEEFLLVCPETDANVAAKQAQRLREAIGEIEFSLVGHVTASFGVTACVPDDDENGESLLRRAEAALYRAKLNGRNRIEICI